MSAPRGVLWDIGGPIDTEIAAEAMIDTTLRAVASRYLGRAVTPAAFAAANDAAVAQFAPNAYQAILWTLLGPVAEVAWPEVVAALPARPFELRAGIADLLRDLHAAGIKLGLAANQPAAILRDLAAAGVLEVFTAQDVSATIGYRKPDPRLFVHACNGLGLPAEAVVMVGDRIDNDIAPARTLGMATIRFRTGRHRAQLPRTWLEIPQAEADDVPGLRAALWRLLQIS